MKIIFSISFGFSLLLISLLFKQFKRNKANLFLILLLSAVSFGCLYSLYLSKTTSLYILSFANAIPALFGTLIYVYVRKSLYASKQINWYWYLFYFSPFILALISSYFFNKYPTSLLLDFVLNVLIKIVASLVFMIITHLLIKKHRASLLNTFSNIEHFELNWFDFIVKTAIIIFAIYFVLILLFYLNVKAISNFENITAILTFIFTFSISYFGISSSNTFFQLSKFELIEDSRNEDEIKEQFETSNEEEDEIPAVKKYIVKQLYDKKLENIYQKLLSILKEEKPYLNENLTIEDLAKRLRVHSRYLSYVINSKFNKSFFKLINSYRVLEFNEKVLNPENKNFTFLSIAFECGFGSKSTFNRAYKNEMNISPSEFIKSKHQ